MPSLVLSDFRGGLNTKLDPWKLQPNQLQAAENVILRNGRLDPLPDLGSAVTTGLGSGNWTWIYKLGNQWLASTTQRYAVLWQNIYLAYIESGNSPQYTNGTSISNLGLSSPLSAPTATDSGTGNITNATVQYVVTYYDVLGQESGPSPLSNLLNLTGRQVSLTNIPTGPGSTVGRKIYRLVSGAFLLVTTIANNTATTFTDNTADTGLTSPLLTDQAGAAPTMKGLFINTYAARLWGWDANTIYWSNAGIASAWNMAGKKLSDNVVAGGSVGNINVALTASKPWIITGTTNATFTFNEANNVYGCPTGAGFSLVKTDKGLVYWSTQGLVLIDGGGGFTLLTREALGQSDVDVYNAVASSMIGAYWNGYYMLFTSAGTLTCDLRDGPPVFTTNTQAIGAAFTALDGTLYVSVGSQIYPWAQGANRLMRVQTPSFTDADLYGPFHVRRAAVFTDGSVTPQWYQNSQKWGAYGLVDSKSGYCLCWTALGNWDRPSLELTTTSTINQIEVNAEL